MAGSSLSVLWFFIGNSICPYCSFCARSSRVIPFPGWFGGIGVWSELGRADLSGNDLLWAFQKWPLSGALFTGSPDLHRGVKPCLLSAYSQRLRKPVCPGITRRGDPGNSIRRSSDDGPG